MAEHLVLCPECGKMRELKSAHAKVSLCASCAKKGERNPMKGSYKNTIRTHHKGYIVVRLDKNDFFYSMSQPTKYGYVYEHRLIMAKHLNRCLLPWEVVHHKNGITNDNRLENLELLGSNSRHNKQLNFYILKFQQEIKVLQGRVTILEAENISLKKSLITEEEYDRRTLLHGT